MSFNDLLFMRHELVLLFIAILVLMVEVFAAEKYRKLNINIAIMLTGVSVFVGFVPQSDAVLFGGMYHADGLRILMKNILNIGLFIVLLQASAWLKLDKLKGKSAEFFFLIFSSMLGMFFMISAGDFLMLYLGMELATIPVAVLAAYNVKKTASIEAGIKMIFSSALSTALMLFGISLIYGVSGSIYFPEVKTAFQTLPSIELPTLALILFISGMAFKISLVPFHLWTADVYQGAPVSVTAFLSVVSKGAAAFVLTFVLFTVFGSSNLIWRQILIILAILTMTIGNLFALRQDNLKRFFAFSSIAQAGFILLGILAQSQMGMSSVIYFLLVYVFTNLAAFGVITAIYNHLGKENISDLKGFYSTNKGMSLALVLALFSLAGVPPMAGFFGKFFLLMSIGSVGNYALLIAAVLNTVIALYYYLKPIKAMFIETTENPIPYFKSDFNTRLAMGICVAGIVAVGLFGVIYDYIFALSIGV